MPALLSILLPLLAQAGVIGAAPGNGPALPQAPIALPQRKASALAPVRRAPSPSGPLQSCLRAAQDTPDDAIDIADAWLLAAKTMTERSGASQCKALALSAQENWAEAAAQFAAARDQTPASEPGERARLGALAGNALVAAGAMAPGLTALNQAERDALAAGDIKQRGELQIGRARALVTLGRLAEAGAALSAARTQAPGDYQAWLLSATLSRRQNRLADAQQQIERAALLMPLDPVVGVEAGVIAVLSGRDAAARRSWQSVIAVAPASPAAKTAQGYLDQLGPAGASAKP